MKGRIPKLCSACESLLCENIEQSPGCEMFATYCSHTGAFQMMRYSSKGELLFGLLNGPVPADEAARQIQELQKHGEPASYVATKKPQAVH